VSASRYDVMRSLALYGMVAIFGAGSLLSAVLAAVAFLGTPYLILELDLPIGGRGIPPDGPGGGAYLIWGVALVLATLLAPRGLLPSLRRWGGRVVRVADPADRPGHDTAARPTD
jgi:ABC-type branched-subunit amino acid transport system permease subunit